MILLNNNIYNQNYSMVLIIIYQQLLIIIFIDDFIYACSDGILEIDNNYKHEFMSACENGHLKVVQ